MGNLLTSVWIDWDARHPNTLVLYGDKVLVGSDRHTRAPADFNGISQTLTGRKMTLLPARASSVVQAGYRRYAGGAQANASRNQNSRRRTGLSFGRFVRSLPGVLLLAFVVVGSSLLGIQRLFAWMRPAVQTSRQYSVEFASFEGRYKCQDKSGTHMLTVNSEEHRLYANSDREHIELLPTAKNEFRVNQDLEGFTGTLTFSRNAKGKVVSLTRNTDDGQKVVCQRVGP